MKKTQVQTNNEFAKKIHDLEKLSKYQQSYIDDLEKRVNAIGGAQTKCPIELPKRNVDSNQVRAEINYILLFIKNRRNVLSIRINGNTIHRSEENALRRSIAEIDLIISQLENMYK